MYLWKWVRPVFLGIDLEDYRDTESKQAQLLCAEKGQLRPQKDQLAEKAGLTTSYIGQIEAPNRYQSFSFDTLFLIAKALDIPPYKILDFD